MVWLFLYSLVAGAWVVVYSYFRWVIIFLCSFAACVKLFLPLQWTSKNIITSCSNFLFLLCWIQFGNQISSLLILNPVTSSLSVTAKVFLWFHEWLKWYCLKVTVYCHSDIILFTLGWHFLKVTSWLLSIRYSQHFVGNGP